MGVVVALIIGQTHGSILVDEDFPPHRQLQSNPYRGFDISFTIC
jgi:hypothetical protein